MKAFLFLAALFAAGSLYAAQPVSVLLGRPESSYSIAQSTVAISSQTTTSDLAVSGYRLTCISNLTAATTVYYRIDGSTASVATVGWPIFPGTNGCLESNNLTGFQLGAGSVGSADFRKKVIRK